MTDPIDPSHDEPAEGPRDDDYSAGPATPATDGAGDAAGESHGDHGGTRRVLE